MPTDGPLSILKLLDTPVGGASPITITNWDLAFVKSLYASDPNLYASGQRGEIRWRMRKNLEASTGPDKRR